MGEWMYRFLTSVLAGDEWSASRPGRFTLGTSWIGGWVDARAGLDDLEKRKFLTLPGLELRHLRRPARSQSLYRLSYPGSSSHGNNFLQFNNWRMAQGTEETFGIILCHEDGAYRPDVVSPATRCVRTSRKCVREGRFCLKHYKK
jgi:hypothetical protein